MLQEGSGRSTACVGGSTSLRSRASPSATSPGRQRNAGLSARVKANISQVIYRASCVDIVFLKTHQRSRTSYFFLSFVLFFRQHTVSALHRAFCKPPVSPSSSRQDKNPFTSSIKQKKKKKKRKGELICSINS